MGARRSVAPGSVCLSPVVAIAHPPWSPGTTTPPARREDHVGRRRRRDAAMGPLADPFVSRFVSSPEGASGEGTLAVARRLRARFCRLVGIHHRDGSWWRSWGGTYRHRRRARTRGRSREGSSSDPTSAGGRPFQPFRAGRANVDLRLHKAPAEVRPNTGQIAVPLMCKMYVSEGLLDPAHVAAPITIGQPEAACRAIAVKQQQGSPDKVKALPLFGV